jgi:hypothetical protein
MRCAHVWNELAVSVQVLTCKRVCVSWPHQFKNGQSALILACKNDHFNAASILVKNGANLEARDKVMRE